MKAFQNTVDLQTNGNGILLCSLFLLCMSEESNQTSKLWRQLYFKPSYSLQFFSRRQCWFANEIGPENDSQIFVLAKCSTRKQF